MMEFTLPLPECFDTNGILFQQFTTFCSRYECYRKTSLKSDTWLHTSLLLYAAQTRKTELSECLKTMDLELSKLSQVLEAIERICLPYFILLFERFRFFTLEQDISETLMDFVKVLRKQGELCEFGNVRDTIMTNALVSGARDENLRHPLQKSRDLNFDKAISLCNEVQNSVGMGKVPPTIQKDLEVKLSSSKSSEVAYRTRDNSFTFLNNAALSEETNAAEDAEEPVISICKRQNIPKGKHSKRARQFLCSICANKYQSRRSLRRHVCSKHPDVPCKLCKKTVTNGVETITRCKYHVAVGVGTKFLCWYCDQPFTDQARYRQHCLTHSTFGVFRCDLCQTKHSITRIIGHVRGHLSPRYKCEVCASHFKKPELLASHIKTHNARRHHSCSVCSKTFVSVDRLQGHMRTHLGKKRFTCELCGKSFSQKMSFDYHTRWHSGEKPYECEICGVRARTSGDLRKHKRVHSDKRPYVCEVCGKSFRCISNLNRHRKSHSGKRSYVCDVCGRSFIYVEGLRDHIKAGRCPGRKAEESSKSSLKSRASRDGNFSVSKSAPEGNFSSLPPTAVSSASVWPAQPPPDNLVHDFVPWQYPPEADGHNNTVVFPSYYSTPPFM